ncbi:MAG: MFS transporter [Lachnospiraceae bacterium]|nr:MFS transporter [Lachnospiraceae bacterium]
MKENPSKIRIFRLAVLFFWFSQYTYVPNLSSYLKELGASLTLIGIVTGSYGFTQMVARIPLGILSDRIGKRKIFVSLGFLLSFVSNMLFLLFRNDVMLVIARGTAGLAASAWVVITVLYSSYFSQGTTTRSISGLNAVNNLGRLLGMLLAGIALVFFSGYRAMFWVGAAGAAIAFILSLSIEENVPEKRNPMTLRRFLYVIRDRKLLLISLAALLSQIYNTSTVSGFTPLFAAELGADSFMRSILNVVNIAMGILGALLAGRISSEKGREKGFLIVSIICLCIATAGIPFARNLPGLFLLQAAGGLFFGGISSLLMGLAIRHIPGDQRSTAMGFYQAIYGIGMFLGPVIVGRIGDAYGLKIGYYVVAVFLLFMIPLISAWAAKE